MHAIASLDGDYRYSCCFSTVVSTTTGKVIAYKVATNSYITCSRYQNKIKTNTLSIPDRHNCDAHKNSCQAESWDDADIYFESTVAPETNKKADERGANFSTVICDGDNDNVESMNQSCIYPNLGNNINIKIECLNHAVRTLMNDIIKQVK